MANQDKTSPILKFNSKDDMKESNIQPFGRIGFLTIRSKMKQKLAKISFKARMVEVPWHHSSDNHV